MVDAQHRHLLLVLLNFLSMRLDVSQQLLLLLKQGLLLAAALFESEVVLYVLLDAGNLLIEESD